MSAAITRSVRVTMPIEVPDLVDLFSGLTAYEQADFFRRLAELADALGLSIEELTAVRVLAGLPVGP